MDFSAELSQPSTSSHGLSNGLLTMGDGETCRIVTVCFEPVPVVRASEIPVVNSRGEDDLILVLDVSASTDHVIARRSDGAVFLRQGDNSVGLNHDQITALEYDKNQRRFEYELAAMQYVYARGRITVGELSDHLGRSVKVSRPTLRGLVDKGLLDWHGSNPKDPSQYYDLHR